MRNSSTAMSSPPSSAAVSSTASAWWVTSGPTPSPGSTTMRTVTGLPRRASGPASSAAAQRQRDLVEALEKPSPLGRLDGEPEAQVPGAHPTGLEVDGAFHARLLAGEVDQCRHLVFGQGHREQPAAQRIAVEDVRERRGDDRAKALVLQCPHGVLARRAAAEVAPRHQNRAAAVRLHVEHEVGTFGAAVVVAGVEEEEGPVAGALDALEELLGDDLVGVDVGSVKRHDPPVLTAKRRHGTACPTRARKRRTSVMRPSMAAAAAMGGETRWVRPPRPCRPSKLRLLVLTHRCPGWSWSGFMPRHMEQPASRHSAPDARNIPSSPSFSACSLTCCDPGTTSTRTPSATRCPSITSAAMRRSSMREFVQEPMNTVSMVTSSIWVPGVRPM